MEISSTERQVGLPTAEAAMQKLLKSCSPTRCAAPRSMAAMSRFGPTYQLVRSVNTQGTSPVARKYLYSRHWASKRAEKPRGRSSTERTTTPSPVSAFSDRRSECSVRSRSSAVSMSKETTWARACTPASVRPAHTTSTGRRNSSPRASSNSPCTVRCPGCFANPAKGAPS